MRGMRGITIIEVVVLLAIVALLVGFGALYLHEQRAWEAFRAAHDCKVVADMQGSLSTGVGPALGSNGGVAVVTVSNPGKFAWLCDDGVTYWRNK